MLLVEPFSYPTLGHFSWPPTGVDVSANTISQIWDQGNKRFGVVPKIEKTQNLTPSS